MQGRTAENTTQMSGDAAAALSQLRERSVSFPLFISLYLSLKQLQVCVSLSRSLSHALALSLALSLKPPRVYVCPSPSFSPCDSTSACQPVHLHAFGCSV